MGHEDDRNIIKGTMSEQTVYGGCGAPSPARTRVRTHHLLKWKTEGHKWAMRDAYDFSTARALTRPDPSLLVGDSAANVVYGYDTTHLPISVDELIPLVRAWCAAPRTRWWWPTCRSVATREPRVALATARGSS